MIKSTSPISELRDREEDGQLIEIVSIGASSITVNNGYNYNSTVGFGTTAAVRVTHDNTAALKTAMDDIIAKGGNYLDLPSGTYYANQITVPSGFTLKGNGKNTILKRQFFAYDANDGNGNSLGLIITL